MAHQENKLEENAVRSATGPDQIWNRAKALCGRGVKVFPLEENSKRPVSGFKWKERASSDWPTVQEWLALHPTCNLALLPKDDWLILDLDIAKGGHKSGRESIKEVFPPGESFPRTYTVSTPSGGHHLYFKLPKSSRDLGLGQSNGKVGDGIDVRVASVAGYVVAPPSVTPKGSYEDLIQEQLAVAPDWLIEALSEPNQGEAIEHSKTRHAEGLDRSLLQAPSWLPAPTPFPIHCLPDSIGEFTVQAAEKINMMPEAIGMFSLAMFGAAIGNSYWISLPSGHSEPPALWVLLSMESGSRKSSALHEATRPAEKRDIRLQRRNEKAFAQYEQDLREYKAAESKAKRENGGVPQDKFGNELTPPSKPSEKHEILDGFTPEKAVQALIDNPAGLLLKTDELKSVLGNLGSYSKGATGHRETLAKLNDGYRSKTMRKSEGSKTTERGLMSLVSTTQPDLQGLFYADDAISGFMARFLVVQPREQPWKSLMSMSPIDYGAEERYNEVYSACSRLKDTYIAETEDETGNVVGGPVFLSMNQEAVKSLDSFGEARKNLASTLESSVGKSRQEKMLRVAMRICLIIHVVEQMQNSGSVVYKSVSSDTMDRALVLSEWIADEQLRIDYYSGALDSTVDAPVPSQDVFNSLLGHVRETFKTGDLEIENKRQGAGMSRATLYRRLADAVEEGVVDKIGRGEYKKPPENRKPEFSEGYAKKALERHVGRLAMETEGARNQTLYKSSFHLGAFVGAGIISEEEVVTALMLAADKAGLGKHETEATIRSGMQSGKANPIDSITK